MSEQTATQANEWGELEAACGDAISALTHLQAFFAHKRMHQASPVVLAPVLAVPSAEQPVTPETWLTPQEVADRLRVKESTVRYWLRNGKIEAFKVDFTWRIPLTALDKRYKKLP